jgi:signal transduction histidine kinase
VTHESQLSSSGSLRSSLGRSTAFDRDGLEAVLAAAEVGLWRLLPDGRAVSITSAMYRLLGVRDDERPETSEQWLGHVHPADLDRVAGELERLRGHNGPFTLEVRAHTSESVPRWVEIRGLILRDESGEFGGACGTMQDVTHRKEPEVFRDLLLATLSHDLRDPLTAIQIGTSLLLRRERLEPRGAVTAERVIASARRISAMVDQVLDFSRLRVRGSLPCNRRATNLVLIAANVIDELELANAGRKILLHYEGNVDGQWDADRLARMIANLVSNALRHGDPESPVTVRVVDEGSDALLVVHNMGSTIPMEDLATIFDPFRRPARPRNSVGLGLGLFIAHEIARSHGGKMWASSSKERGTEFAALLPRRV